MGAFSYLRSIYDLDTLDTRYTITSKTPYKTYVESRNDPGASKARAAKFGSRVQPSKWRTPEFYMYGVVMAVVIPAMLWVTYSVSRPSNPQYKKFERYLSPGWVPGRKIDISDNQYHSFRGNLTYLAALLTFHPLLRRLYNTVFHPVTSLAKSSRPTLDEADDRLNQRASFDFGFALVFLVALHGISAFKVLTILYLNYQIATTLPRKYIPLGTWVFNIAILFANDLGKGYRLGDLAALLSNPVGGSVVDADTALVAWGKWLDSYGGIMSRWHVLFNITVLRLISFNMDYYWGLDRRGYSPLEKKQLDPSSLSEHDRVTIPAQSKDFSFRNYIAYTIYAPLYLTGPIVTFNDYISQIRYRPATIETSRTIRYGIRFLGTLLAMELILHFNYVQAMTKADPAWGEYTARQLSLLSYFNLHMIWLKLLLPWRLFRLWALIDGIDPPENMVRCVSNNYSTRSFWRSWHRSYNRWITRYIHIPLGGSLGNSPGAIARAGVNFAITFTFVAVWHDIQLNLLVWSWLIVLFMMPELLAEALFPPKRWEKNPVAYRAICAVGGIINIITMMMANLVGFGMGLEGVYSILKGIGSDVTGLTFLAMALTSLFMAVQVMFEVRESELRRGISLRC